MTKQMLPARIWSIVLKYKPKRIGDISELCLYRSPRGFYIRYSYHDRNRGLMWIYEHDVSIERFMAIRSIIRGELLGIEKHRRVSEAFRELRYRDSRYDH